MHIALVVIALFALGSSAVSQTDLVKNGDFESGFSPWQTSGNAFLPRIEKFDCDGDGQQSNSFRVTPGPVGFSLFQDTGTTLTNDKVYWFRMAVRGTGTIQPANNWSRIDLWIGTKQAPAVNRIASFFPHSAGMGQLFEFSAAFRPAGDRTHVLLSFYTGRSPGVAFEVRVDNVELYEVGELPWSTCGSVRNNDPQSIKISTFGDTQASYVLYLGTKRLPQGIKLPGVGGTLELDPAGGLLFLAAAIFDARTGWSTLTFPLPAEIYRGIRGKPLYWMPVQFKALPQPTITIGKVGLWSFL